VKAALGDGIFDSLMGIIPKDSVKQGLKFAMSKLMDTDMFKSINNQMKDWTGVMFNDNFTQNDGYNLGPKLSQDLTMKNLSNPPSAYSKLYNGLNLGTIATILCPAVCDKPERLPSLNGPLKSGITTIRQLYT